MDKGLVFGERWGEGNVAAGQYARLKSRQGRVSGLPVTAIGRTPGGPDVVVSLQDGPSFQPGQEFASRLGFGAGHPTWEALVWSGLCENSRLLVQTSQPSQPWKLPLDKFPRPEGHPKPGQLISIDCPAICVFSLSPCSVTSGREAPSIFPMSATSGVNVRKRQWPASPFPPTTAPRDQIRVSAQIAHEYAVMDL